MVGGLRNLDSGATGTDAVSAALASLRRLNLVDRAGEILDATV
ncbi:hypothetical protein OG413_44230 [Streptomyces sp. NBC_01433]|nr:hypothetical protein [Streptomyces sp. NBC_01433]MCX4682192.1 hypothetical protein [Streptomyces sp. NBC_01433]